MEGISEEVKVEDRTESVDGDTLGMLKRTLKIFLYNK